MPPVNGGGWKTSVFQGVASINAACVWPGTTTSICSWLTTWLSPCALRVVDHGHTWYCNAKQNLSTVHWTPALGAHSVDPSELNAANAPSWQLSLGRTTETAKESTASHTSQHPEDCSGQHDSQNCQRVPPVASQDSEPVDLLPLLPYRTQFELLLNNDLQYSDQAMSGAQENEWTSADDSHAPAASHTSRRTHLLHALVAPSME